MDLIIYAKEGRRIPPAGEKKIHLVLDASRRIDSYADGIIRLKWKREVKDK